MLRYTVVTAFACAGFLSWAAGMLVWPDGRLWMWGGVLVVFIALCAEVPVEIEKVRSLAAEAKRRECTVTFIYEDLDGNMTRRMVSPTSVDSRRLSGLCCHRGEPRHFDLRRMHGVELGPGYNEVQVPLGEPEAL